jgi:hypothetical protein
MRSYLGHDISHAPGEKWLFVAELVEGLQIFLQAAVADGHTADEQQHDGRNDDQPQDQIAEGIGRCGFKHDKTSLNLTPWPPLHTWRGGTRGDIFCKCGYELMILALRALTRSDRFSSRTRYQISVQGTRMLQIAELMPMVVLMRWVISNPPSAFCGLGPMTTG